MNYEKAYKELIEKLKNTVTEKGEYTYKSVIEEIFPELKENEDEKIRKWLIGYFHQYKEDGMEEYANGLKVESIIAWLEKQGEFYTKRDVDNAYIEGMAFAKDELEKQGEQKGYTFKSIPRLLDMIEPSDKAKAYCQKLIDTLVKEGYNTDAKIVEEVLKGWNGEDVPMAVMDEQKPFDYENANIQQTDFAPKVDMPRYSIGDVLCDKSCTTLDKEAQPNFEIIDIRNGMYICDKCSFPISQQDEYELVAKKIEQKPTDKVKPKFKVGDWVVQENIGVYKVIEVCESWYEVIDGEDNHYSISFDNEYMCHLWDITKDAKDGDVLISRYNKPFIYNGNWNSLNIGSYCGITTEGMFNVATEKCYWTGNVNIHPATKEQCNLLFQKMYEAGYEWNTEMKELRKIHVIDEGKDEMDYCFTKMMNSEKVSPAWSEEDEVKLKSACALIRNTSINGNEGIEDFTINWLKSLKGRIQTKQGWKPSNEQMESLFALLPTICSSNPIFSLYEDLKKLKG